MRSQRLTEQKVTATTDKPPEEEEQDKQQDGSQRFLLRCLGAGSDSGHDSDSLRSEKQSVAPQHNNQKSKHSNAKRSILSSLSRSPLIQRRALSRLENVPERQNP